MRAMEGKWRKEDGTGNGKIRLFVLDDIFGKDLGELGADVARGTIRAGEGKRVEKDGRGRGSDGVFVSYAQVLMEWGKQERWGTMGKARTETNGSASRGTRVAARAREQVLTPPG